MELLGGVLKPVRHAALKASTRNGKHFFIVAGTALLIAISCGRLSCSARAATFQDIYSFYTTPPNNPAGGLTLGVDGNFYGTAYSGGLYDCGCVFKVTPGGVLTTVVSFSGTSSIFPGGAGAHPRGKMVQDSAGNLYGVTYSGGYAGGYSGNSFTWITNNAGTIFQATPGGTLTTLHYFANDAAVNPYGGLIKGMDGNFYGTTETYGTIFKITPAGKLTTLSSFFGLNGYSLNGPLAQGTDGYLYGAAGLKAFNQQGGIIFRCDTNGVSTVLAQFNGTNGEQPYGGLVQAGDGNLYGTTSGGGLYGDGTIFSVSTSGVFAKLLDFNGTNGAYPFAPLIAGSDGNLYGGTIGGGVQGQGTLFMISTNGAFSSFFSFSGTNGSGVDGQLLEYGGGTFYGTTRGGGANGEGTVFGITTNGSIAMLVSFASDTGEQPSGSLTQGTNGNFYGTALGGGVYGLGTIFEMSANGTVSVLACFTNSLEGRGPTSPLLPANDGNFYGTTQIGGVYNEGTVYQLTPGGVLNTIFSFAYTNGANPFYGLIQGSDGTFYGSTMFGGLGPGPSPTNFYGGYGALFNITSNGAETTLALFAGTNGANPSGLMQANDGNFYGTTYSGGSSNLGTVFQLMTGGALNSLFTFSGANGANPAAGLVQGKTDGALYGTTSSGGAWGCGTVFKITTNGMLTTLASFSGTNGSNCFAGLIQGSDGNFYGLTVFGGDNNLGTVFQITTGGAVSVLHSFSQADGEHTSASLLQGSDGYLYGTTSEGGSGHWGTIFRINPAPSLQISLVGSQVQLSWPTSAGNFVLESNPDLTTTNWSVVTDTPTTNSTQIVLPQFINSASQFYRLRLP